MFGNGSERPRHIGYPCRGGGYDAKTIAGAEGSAKRQSLRGSRSRHIYGRLPSGRSATASLGRYSISRRIRRDTHDDKYRTRRSRGRLFLGNAGSDPPQARRHIHARRLFRRRGQERDLSQPRQPCRGDRDRFRSPGHQLSGSAGILLPDPRSDHARSPGQRHRRQLSVGDFLYQPGTGAGRARHHRRCRGVRPVAGQGGDRSCRRWATSGRPSPNIRIISSATRTGTPVTLSARAGNCRGGWRYNSRAGAEGFARLRIS